MITKEQAVKLGSGDAANRKRDAMNQPNDNQEKLAKLMAEGKKDGWIIEDKEPTRLPHNLKTVIGAKPNPPSATPEEQFGTKDGRPTLILGDHRSTEEKLRTAQVQIQCDKETIAQLEQQRDDLLVELKRTRAEGFAEVQEMSKRITALLATLKDMRSRLLRLAPGAAMDKCDAAIAAAEGRAL